jgi:hypothetical protein
MLPVVRLVSDLVAGKGNCRGLVYDEDMSRLGLLSEEMPVLADLDDGALIRDAVEWQRVRSFVDARQQASFAELARRRVADATPVLLAREGAHDFEESTDRAHDRVLKWCGDEFAPALRLAPATARQQVEEALTLVDRFPAVWRALLDGRITAYKARSFVRALADLDPEVAADVVAKLLPDAGDFTPGQLQAAIKRTIIAVDPEGAQDRHDRAKGGRHVRSAPADDAMGWLNAYLTVDELAKVMAVLDAYAYACPHDDPRSIDERRTDALVELVTGEPTSSHPVPDLPPEVRDLFAREDTHEDSDRDSDRDSDEATKPDELAGVIDAIEAPQAVPNSEETVSTPATKPSRLSRRIRVDLRVVIGAGTLLGLDDEPGYLAGYGHIPADLARRLAADSTMRRFLTNPTTGILLSADHERYRAPAWLHDYIESRDLTCRWPGCRRDARRCDKDHSIPFPEGHTCKENLICLCRYHHFLKTHGDWSVLLLPDGTYQVTSPTGEVYTTRPPKPGGVVPPTRTGKSIYLDPRDDPDFALPKTKREPYPAEPPF